MDTQKKSPQEELNAFWDNFMTKAPGKVTSIFPHSLYTNLLPPKHLKQATVTRNAAESYKIAADECRKKVQRIAEECRRTNEKFTDPDFDIEGDFGYGNCLHGLLSFDDDSDSDSDTDSDSEGSVVSVDGLRDCLDLLVSSKILGPESTAALNIAAVRKCLAERQQQEYGPRAVHRVDYIYEKPSFCVDGYSTDDVRQGVAGDCWWVSAVSTLCGMKELMNNMCVAREPECGVYGFVFFRDGEWFSTVVDDNLYLTNADYTSAEYDSTGEEERDYRKLNQTGSKALYFAYCSNKNETWLPLLEKAYAKVHGDYDAIDSGVSGEAVEDMTGGVTTSLRMNKVLDKNGLWKELLTANKDFVFAAQSRWPTIGFQGMRGLAPGHAYSILEAREELDKDNNVVRLVLLRNPWGKRSRIGVGEWTGSWSDGSKEWTTYWMDKLNHKFGDEGRFWMSYDDLLHNFESLDRTRLFRKEWTVVQRWTGIHVSWVTGFLNTQFLVKIKKRGLTVFVLSQLDTRYFRGLAGQYEFELHFILQGENAPVGEHIVRARGYSSGSRRSVSAEVDLGPGQYKVLPKILATRNKARAAVEDVVKKWAERKPQKLRQIGLNYDLAHAKAFGDDWETDTESGEEETEESEEVEEQEDPPVAPPPQLPSVPLPEAGDIEGEDIYSTDGDIKPPKPQPKIKPWNAVCAIGLRVYSKDPEVSIELVKPEDAEEGAALALDGSIPAGATM